MPFGERRVAVGVVLKAEGDNFCGCGSSLCMEKINEPLVFLRTIPLPGRTMTKIMMMMMKQAIMMMMLRDYI